jgi:hypothetical protein
MIDKLLGKIVFQNSSILDLPSQKKEEKEELNHLDLFVYSSPSKIAKGIGAHLGHFSREFIPLPCYLSTINKWVIQYQSIIASDHKFKKFKSYPYEEFKKYLLHKVIICKVVRDEVFSNNVQILTAVNAIKIQSEGYHLVGKAKKE